MLIFNRCRSKWKNTTTGGVVLHSPRPLRVITERLTFIKVDMTFGACVAYLVDVMHSRSSEMLATVESVHFAFIYRFGTE